MSSETDMSRAMTQPASSSWPEDQGILLLQAGAEPVPEYRLVELLGRGGFGDVWKATGPGGVPVAMKFVPQNEDAGSLELRSLEFMKDIRHPHLLSIFGAWQCRGYVILAMELADRTLGERYKEAVAKGLPGIPLGELLEYMREAAKGIDYLNSLGIQHRDIKPHNLFLVGGSVKIADFGLAKPLASLPFPPRERERREGAAVSPHSGAMTPVYAPPEFFNGRATDMSDQYSLAVTYCQLRSGRLPFSGGTAIEVMNNVLDKEPNLDMLTPEERPIVARALAKSPHERWPNCRAFAAALTECAPPEDQMLPLSRCQDSVGLVEAFKDPNQVGDGAAPGRRPRSRPRFAKAAGLALVLLIVVGYAAWRLDWLGIHESPPLVELACLRGHTAEVTCVAFSPNGQLLSGGADRTLRLWDVGREELVRTFDKHVARVTCVAIPDYTKAMAARGLSGNRVASGSEDKTVRVWDFETGHDYWHSEPAKAAVTAIAFSPDGATVLAGYDDATLRIWDAAAGKLIKELKAYNTTHRGSLRVTGVAFTSDNQRIIASRGNTIGIWKVDSDKPGTFSWPGGLVLGDPIRAIATADGGSRLVVGQASLLRCCHLDDGKEIRRISGHSDPITAIALASGGRLAITGSDDHTVRLWDLSSGRELGHFAGHTAAVLAVAVSPDRKLAASAGMDQAVRLMRLPK